MLGVVLRAIESSKFIVFHLFYEDFRGTPSAQVDIILGSFLEASWNDLGRLLGYQDSA